MEKYHHVECVHLKYILFLAEDISFVEGRCGLSVFGRITS